MLKKNISPKLSKFYKSELAQISGVIAYGIRNNDFIYVYLLKFTSLFIYQYSLSLISLLFYIMFLYAYIA